MQLSEFLTPSTLIVLESAGIRSPDELLALPLWRLIGLPLSPTMLQELTNARKNIRKEITVSKRRKGAGLADEIAAIVLRELPLSPRHKQILEMRLNGASLRETGKVFSITRERVRQIEARVLDRIRYHYRDHAADLDRLQRLQAARRRDPSRPEIPLRHVPIEILELGPRATNALIDGGIGSLEQLCKCSETTLLSLHGFGPTTVQEVKDALATRNLHLLAT